jgi:hypothetical protein
MPSTPECLVRAEAGAGLAIVSRLYELFADNALIARSPGGLAKAMQPGSLLIYTNQPWHPQLEMSRAQPDLGIAAARPG